MKTVTMSRNHDVTVQASPRVVRHYRGGVTYPDALEFDVAAIVAAGAGTVAAKETVAVVKEKPATRRRRKGSTRNG